MNPTNSNPPPGNPSIGASSSEGNSSNESPHRVSNNVVHPLQAAHMEHKEATTLVPIVLLAEGDTPQTPRGIRDSSDSATPKPRRTKTKKPRDNHVSVRFQDAELELLTERMNLTGENQSVAVRNLILESTGKGGNIHLSPRTPPEELEVLLGALKKWRAAFATAKPRLNMATPDDDDGRYKQVIAWRKEADRLLAEIPIMEIMVKACISAVTNLTPEKVARLRKGLPLLADWKKGFAEKQKEFNVNLIQDLIDILEGAGIKPE